MRNREYALIVAGGSGTRMQTKVPKQFLLLGGKPVLMHTIQAFNLYAASLQIIVVLPGPEIEEWKRLCALHGLDVPHQVVKGGSSRTDSVRKGLEMIEDSKGVVAIHDGVRPLVSSSIISESFRVAQEKGNAVAAVRLKDSIRRLEEEGSSRSEDREQFRIVQTPQTFLVAVIKEAYAQISVSEVLSDDASLIERYGKKIHLIEGHYRNIKITTPEDLSIAEAFMSYKSL